MTTRYDIRPVNCADARKIYTTSDRAKAVSLLRKKAKDGFKFESMKFYGSVNSPYIMIYITKED